MANTLSAFRECFSRSNRPVSRRVSRYAPRIVRRFKESYLPSSAGSTEPRAGSDTMNWERGMPKILDGVEIASAIKREVAEEVKRLAGQSIRPGLAAVLVGHVPASEI